MAKFKDKTLIRLPGEAEGDELCIMKKNGNAGMYWLIQTVERQDDEEDGELTTITLDAAACKELLEWLQQPI